MFAPDIKTCMYMYTLNNQFNVESIKRKYNLNNICLLASLYYFFVLLKPVFNFDTDTSMKWIFSFQFLRIK